MNWQAAYGGVSRGMFKFAHEELSGGAVPRTEETIKYQVQFMVALQGIVDADEEKYLDCRYIDQREWCGLLREWRRDAKMLRDLDDAIGGDL